MTVVLAAAVGLVAADVAAFVGRRRPGPVGLVAASLVLHPPATVALLGLAAAGWAARRRGQGRRRQVALRAEVVALGELTALGVAAGLSFPAALTGAAAEVDSELRVEVARVLARARVDGHAVAFAAAEGRAGELYRLAGRALATGAPLARSLEAFVAGLRDEERARRLAAARRLPVRLLVPLSLLILPGFVLLTAGPALLAGLARLGG